MTKNTTAFRIALGFLIASSVALTACQRQESGNPPTKAPEPAAVNQPLQSVASSKVATPVSIIDNLAIKDLLHRVVRSDLPGMTFEQVKTLFPTTCVANDDDRSISCPGVAGLASVSYGGGPDGIFDMVFSGGMASCKILKTLVSQRFGKGEDYDIPDRDSDAACGMHWNKINPKHKIYYANLRKLKGDDEVTLQIGAEQGP